MKTLPIASPVQIFPAALRVSWSRMKQAYFLLGRAYSKVSRLDEVKPPLRSWTN
jgi:hypothetical protein